MTRLKPQPTAEMMREQLRLAADEIIRLRTERDWMNRHMVAGAWRFRISVPGGSRLPWYRRLFRKTDKQTAALAALERV